MKKVLTILLAAVLAVCLCAGASAQTELTVFAAASLTETLNEIKGVYETANPEVTLIFNFDSSGTLKTQIEEGADCDVFISAAQKQMNQLDIAADETANPDRLDCVLDGSRVNLLENRVALVVPADNPRGIDGFDALAALLRDGEVLLAMGNLDVPVGQYTQKILKYYELDEEQLASAGKITYGSNVKEVTTQVVEGSVDCGVVYATDAFSAGLDVTDSATEEMCGRVVYPAAVMKNSISPDAARAFLDWLRGPEAMSVFESVGFSAIGPAA
ncbi:MAG: molybdate ABC transporter substrate-binding protein [Clostridia bacterium]|nr:molybdate ABC transporter substrate-binding protein [Clostridia bacterium]